MNTLISVILDCNAQPDQSQWNGGGYYGYPQGYDAYGYVRCAAAGPQDPSMYYGGYPGYGNYQQPGSLPTATAQQRHTNSNPSLPTATAVICLHCGIDVRGLMLIGSRAILGCSSLVAGMCLVFGVWYFDICSSVSSVVGTIWGGGITAF
ncbi:hypothetical protein H0E87_000286 [Populus deltoides]|uniref:Uncharacterized protein n=1 Tax=Populus deltoides TaxID=3696 RepID=A0A8T2ZM53_POPDE|nr:hypothetical protein H0E87_000286 [Populus deltoides]